MMVKLKYTGVYLNVIILLKICIVGARSNLFTFTKAQYIVNNHPLTKNKPIYHARISEQMKRQGFPEPFHLFTFRA